MSETKEDIATARDALLVENAQLRAQLATGGRQVNAPAHQFLLSEGGRQELITYGVTTVNGRRVTAEQVSELLGDAQADVELGDTKPVDGNPAARPNLGIPGVDFVYPSVVPGAIDPAVAGTPGINGPAATPAQLAAAESLADSDVTLIDN
jgi:hypothetical protein